MPADGGAVQTTNEFNFVITEESELSFPPSYTVSAHATVIRT
jgi:hypothetical protein